jgi:starch synthase
MAPIDILSVVSEAYPLVKTGGLADVVGALPAALAAEGVRVRTLVPGYPAVLAALPEPAAVHGLAELYGGTARLLAGTVAGLDLLVLDVPHLYDRPGGPYLGLDGQDWPDNGLRFAALARVAAEIGTGGLAEGGPGGLAEDGAAGLAGWSPDIVHAHDWQAGLVPAYLHYRGAARPRSVLTVHNLAFPGKFPPEMLTALDLPQAAMGIDGIEFYGMISMLKAGLRFADRVTTVSPTYAAEIQTEAEGMGFDGVLRSRGRAVCGILNGIDDHAWNPQTDAHLTAPFAPGRWAARAANKAALQESLGLEPDPQALLFGVVSRLTWQKGLDLLLDSVPALLAEGAQLALLGAGDPVLEAGFRALRDANPRHVGCVIGYSESLAHQMQAGADALLVPSRFEPCGLTQLYALRYGAIPVVSRVGGLSDTVIDANPMAIGAGVATGVQFGPPGVETLVAAIARTAALYRDRPVWRRMQLNAMQADVSWRGPARRYAALYREMLA